MSKIYIKTILLIACLYSTIGYGQVQVDRIETNLTIEPSSTQTVLDASRSVTIKPTSHFKPGSNVFLQIVENDTYRPLMFTTDNYVYSRSFQKEMTDPDAIVNNSDVIEQITYYDGLGRAKQDIQIKYTPQLFDLVAPMAYDNVGREAKEFLPFKDMSSENAAFRSDALETVNSFYNNNYSSDFGSSEPNPYSEKKFEDAVLNRELKQSMPGYEWRMNGGHEIEYDYKINTTADGVRFFKVTFANDDTQNPHLTESGSYSPKELTRHVIRDENHSSGTDHTMEEFIDKRGRVILKRTYNGIMHDTYYVYDDFNNLTFVLPPKASENLTITAPIVNRLCYQYKYDEKNRMIEKKLPGKGGPNNIWEKIVYNKNDQPILTQDPNLKTLNQWLFTKYDAYGRIAYTGVMERDADRATLQNEANVATTTYVVRKAGVTIGGTTVEYNNSAYPINDIIFINTINYYDNYNFNQAGLTMPTTVFGQALTPNTTDLVTGSRTRVLSTVRNVYQWVTTVIGYDKKGRAIWEAENNELLGTTNIKESKLDFTGRLLNTKTIHKKINQSDIVINDVFEHDLMGRLLTQTQSIGSQTEVLVQNAYDDLGNVIQKKLGNTISTPLQTIDYKYNIRGWLKGINNTSNLDADLFAFTIDYEDIGHGQIPLYNGNISNVQWRTANDNVLRRYAYQYDALDRIIGTNHNPNYDISSITYDKNGNILSLSRNGFQNTNNYSDMDILNYDYRFKSNVLDKVTDTGNKDYGFNDGNTTANDYAYDDNGNMISDLNKNIEGITYNFLNLPAWVPVTGSNAGTISYVYDASGVKLQKKLFTNNTTITTDYAGNFVYENESLKFINHSLGYLEPNSNDNYDYAYYFKDHLGSVRLTFSDTNKNGSIDPNTEIIQENNFYPFGMKHKGYNNVFNGTEYNLKSYQGQEFHNELDLGLSEFKYRFYDPSMGRFWSIDPLAEDFAYNSTYAFSENKLGMGIELEGAELQYNDLIFYILRRGQEIADQFNGGVTKIHEATIKDPVINGVTASQAASFNASRAEFQRLDKLSSGLGDVAEATSATGHFALEVAGASQIPIVAEIADGTNAVWYGIEGDVTNATLSGISLIPFGIGDAIGKGGKVLKLVKLSDALQPLGKVADFKIIDDAIDVAETGKWYDFVITEAGELRLGSGHHKLANDGADDLVGAGEVFINDKGKIEAVTGNSGHFQPTEEQGLQAAELLKQAGLTSDNVVFVKR